MARAKNGIHCSMALTGAAWLLLVLMLPTAAAPADRVIDISKENPAYWVYGGKPVLLLGGSVEDNLFQLPDLEAHLDLLASVGGNYVRNTMSCRDEGNVWPFQAAEGGRYDLDRWNEEFWQRFERFLQLTSERDIIVQIEIWATFDYYRDCWARNPFNPKNNSTYTAEESGLPTAVDSHPVACQNNFFWSVPAERNQRVVLKYQERFVAKILSYSLQYGHVLYCMDNETAVTPAWGKYWAEFVRAQAAQAGVKVHTTEMWDPWNLADEKHRATFEHPETYTFADISQNNHQKGQAHWDNAQRVRQALPAPRRPLNNVKIYGADGGRFGSSQDGMERFWRNVFGGLASARFHRPGSGLGLSEAAQANIKSARMLTDALEFTQCASNNGLLSERDANEAYCFAEPGRSYAVYFPQGGEVILDLSKLRGAVSVRWLEIMTSTWKAPIAVEGGGPLPLSCPSEAPWAVLCVSAAAK